MIRILANITLSTLLGFSLLIAIGANYKQTIDMQIIRNEYTEY